MSIAPRIIAPPAPFADPAPRISLPYQPYGFKDTRGKASATRTARSQQPTWADPLRLTNGAGSVSNPLRDLLPILPTGSAGAPLNPWWNVLGISEQLIYQPDPMLMFGSGALFNFGQMPQFPAVVNLLSNPDLWVTKVNATDTALPTLFPTKTAPGYQGGIPAASGAGWESAYTCLPYEFSLAGNGPYTLALDPNTSALWLSTASQIAFQLLDHASPAGATVEVFLSGNTTGTADWTYTARTTNPGGGDNVGGENTAFYTSRLLTPTDNPVIVVTAAGTSGPSGEATCTFTLMPIYPKAAVSPVSALGSGFPFDTTGWDSGATGYNQFVLGDVAVERTPAAVWTNVYDPNLEGFQAAISTAASTNQLGFPTATSPRGYPMASGYAISDFGVDPTNHLAAGTNILFYPNDWVELGTPVSDIAGAPVPSYDPLTGIYSKIAQYGYAYTSGASNTPGWAIQYNETVTAGAILSFSVGADQSGGGIPGTDTYVVNVYLAGDTTKTPDWTATLSSTVQTTSTYTSPALAATDKPVIQILPGGTTTFGATDLYLMPESGTISPNLIGPPGMIRLNSVMNSVLGSYSPPNLVGLGVSNTPLNNAVLSYLEANAATNTPWSKWYFGTTLYYVPSVTASPLLDPCGNNIKTLNGSFFHVGQNDSGPSIDISGNVGHTSVAKGNALVAFGVLDGYFTAWCCDMTVVDTAAAVTEGWVTFGAVVSEFTYNTTATGNITGIKFEFYLNGQFVGDAISNSANNITGVASGKWTSLFEGFANLPSYGLSSGDLLGGYLPTRFYMENLSITGRDPAFVAYNDYFVGQTPVGPGRNVSVSPT